MYIKVLNLFYIAVVHMGKILKKLLQLSACQSKNVANSGVKTEIWKSQ